MSIVPEITYIIAAINIHCRKLTDQSITNDTGDSFHKCFFYFIGTALVSKNPPVYLDVYVRLFCVTHMLTFVMRLQVRSCL